MPPAGHPWWKDGFGPRLAVEKTRANWYLGYEDWHQSGSRAFFLNFWYREFMVVDQAALDLIRTQVIGSSYAAMSPFEFFAELYAVYYGPVGTGRAKVDAAVAQWFDDNVGKYDLAAPMPPSPLAAE